MQRNAYTYDALNRLTQSFEYGGGYSTGMQFSPSGRILQKGVTASATYSVSKYMYYGYCSQQKPHAPRRIYETNRQTLSELLWDAAGNLGQVNTAERQIYDNTRFLFWTEDNRLHTVADRQWYSYYAYDYSGERTLKLTGSNTLLDVNANFMLTTNSLDDLTLYPSPYIVVTGKGYTKHYYVGSDRLCARIGGGGLRGASQNAGLTNKAYGLFQLCANASTSRILQGIDLQCVHNALWDNDILRLPVKGAPQRLITTSTFDLSAFELMIRDYTLIVEQEDEAYFYHGDHLGGANWITDASGLPVQHLQLYYHARFSSTRSTGACTTFGERYVDQHISLSTYSERFTFTGKERDAETGYSYFGARYYDSDLSGLFLSVDPMADKYPSFSPYAYCAWNPVKLVDPDGREMGDFYSNDGTYLNTDGNNDGKVYIVKDKDWGNKIKKDRQSGKNATLDLDKVERFMDENGDDLFLTDDIIKKISSAENLSSDGNEHGYFYRKNNETPERELESFPDHLTFNKYPDLVLSIHTHPQAQDATMSDKDRADLSQIPINIVIGNNKAYESGNVKTSNFPPYRVANFYRHNDYAFTINMTGINKMVKRINKKNK